MTPSITPTKLLLWLTRRCNMNCPGCLWFLKKGQLFFDNVDIPFNSACEIIDYFIANRIQDINLQANGEVLLYPHFKKIIKYINKFELGLNSKKLITNGYFLDQYKDFILKYFNSVTISIDGATPETYKLRRGGDFKVFHRITTNVKDFCSQRLNAHKPFVNINCILTKQTYKDIPAMVRLAQGLGVNSIRFGNYHPFSQDDPFDNIENSDQEIKKYIMAFIDKSNFKIAIYIALFQTYDAPFKCDLLFDTACVNPEGFFSPCCHVEPKESYGNFFKDPMGYNSEKILAFRHKFIEADTIGKLPRECRKCPRLIKTNILFNPSVNTWTVNSI